MNMDALLNAIAYMYISLDFGPVRYVALSVLEDGPF